MKTQASTTLIRGGLTFRLGAMLLLVLLPLVSASARVHHNDAWARQQFAKAERMREALNGRPLAERTRREYQAAIDSYRRVYFGSPTSSKADPSVVATAELMVEMGRRFDDNKVLRGAVDQYRFLRKEYPGSKYRFDALFTIGEIYKDDLNDPEEARAAFADFLHRYPRNRLADDARAAVKEIDTEAGEAKKIGAENPPQTPEIRIDFPIPPRSPARVAMAMPPVRATSRTDKCCGLPPPRVAARHRNPSLVHARLHSRRHRCGDDVNFASQRIANPDRIFFDLPELSWLPPSWVKRSKWTMAS